MISPLIAALGLVFGIVRLDFGLGPLGHHRVNPIPTERTSPSCAPATSSLAEAVSQHRTSAKHLRLRVIEHVVETRDTFWKIRESTGLEPRTT